TNIAALGIETNSNNTVRTQIFGSGGNRVLSLGTGGINHIGGGDLVIGTSTANKNVAISLQGSQTWTSSGTGGGSRGIIIANGVSIGAGIGNQTLTLSGTNVQSGTTVVIEDRNTISDGGGILSIDKTGTGTWTFTSATNSSSYTGATTIKEGTLILMSSG